MAFTIRHVAHDPDGIAGADADSEGITEYWAAVDDRGLTVQRFVSEARAATAAKAVSVRDLPAPIRPEPGWQAYRCHFCGMSTRKPHECPECGPTL